MEIERFFLYGEEARPAGDRFVHLEMLDERSRPANWNIRAHAHRDLHHVFVIAKGGGVASIDKAELDFEGPCLIGVPCGAVHALRMRADTEGRVLTFSDGVLRAVSVREPMIATLFGQGGWVAQSSPRTIEETCARLARELGLAGDGHEAAVEAHLTIVLVDALRMGPHNDHGALAPAGPHAALVARYRGLLEDHFREHPSVEWCAERLNVTPGRLRAACRASAGRSPAQLLHDRLRLESERVMRFSSMSVAQVAQYLGFSDPAYFSRFFAQASGVPPRDYRKRHGRR